MDVDLHEANQPFIASIHLMVCIVEEIDTNDFIAEQSNDLGPTLFIVTEDEDHYQEEEILWLNHTTP